MHRRGKKGKKKKKNEIKNKNITNSIIARDLKVLQ